MSSFCAQVFAGDGGSASHVHMDRRKGFVGSGMVQLRSACVLKKGGPRMSSVPQGIHGNYRRIAGVFLGGMLQVVF